MPNCIAVRWLASVSSLASTTSPSRGVRLALDQRAELAARAAPLGPEVDDDGQLLRALDDLLLERRVGDVDDGHGLTVGSGAAARDRRRGGGVPGRPPARPDGHPALRRDGLEGRCTRPAIASSRTTRAGHGGSEPAPDPDAYGYECLAADLIDVMDELGIERAVLAGASMGAHTAIRVALEEPDLVAGLVLITPAFHPDHPPGLERWDRAERGAAQRRRRRLRRGLRRGASTSTSATARRCSRSSASASSATSTPRRSPTRCAACRARSRSTSLDDLERIEAPTIVVPSRDEADPGHPLEVGEEYAPPDPGRGAAGRGRGLLAAGLAGRAALEGHRRPGGAGLGVAVHGTRTVSHVASTVSIASAVTLSASPSSHWAVSCVAVAADPQVVVVEAAEQRVEPEAAEQRVGADLAADRVVVGLAVDLVVAAAAEQRVVAGAAEDVVVAAEPVDPVGVGVAGERVVAAPPTRFSTSVLIVSRWPPTSSVASPETNSSPMTMTTGLGAHEVRRGVAAGAARADVAVDAAVERVVAVLAEERVEPRVAAQRVAAEPAEQGVVAAPPVEGVVAVAAGQPVVLGAAAQRRRRRGRRRRRRRRPRPRASSSPGPPSRASARAAAVKRVAAAVAGQPVGDVAAVQIVVARPADEVLDVGLDRVARAGGAVARRRRSRRRADRRHDVRGAALVGHDVRLVVAAGARAAENVSGPGRRRRGRRRRRRRASTSAPPRPSSASSPSSPSTGCRAAAGQVVVLRRRR